MIAPNPQDRKLTPQVIISSRLADQMGALAQVYYLARWFDSIDAVGRAKAGSGKSEFTIDIAAAILGRSPGTVRKNLYAAHRLGYFHSIIISRGHVVIYYASEARIGGRMLLSELGAIARIDLAKLKDLKIVATEAHAEALQKSSEHKAKKACKQQDGGLPRKFVDKETLLGPVGKTGYKNWRGRTNVIWRGNRFTFVNEQFALYGASQDSIGRSLGRSSRTIQRRLKDTQKTQLCQIQPQEKPIRVENIN
ncbi:MAG: hypothetical protein VKL39_24055, partial [Leptolyngbyaceae bacterium]|nr:hypothetical protein [Leptolyngbyaceae bacterium]